MIIGISGKIGSGKDTIGHIIQWLTSLNTHIDYKNYINSEYDNETFCDWKIKRFAGKVKEICSILTGIPVADFEKQEVKDRVLGEEWKCYVRTTDGKRMEISLDKDYIKGKTIRLSEWEYRHGNASTNHNWNEHTITVRELLQQVGTEAMRYQIHPNVWVNALFAKYRPLDDTLRTSMGNVLDYSKCPYPNWIITDCRFPNEAEAIKSRGGLLIRVNRIAHLSNEVYCAGGRKSPDWNGKYGIVSNHPSETALDDYQFDEVIDNNGTIEELIENVKLILIKHNVI